ncbi:hypothetical protein AVEN_241898-1 [Araneus ventricosus]|uniref:Uncharacterized protein n=1 Tax=Araneus ventricosus TaxID=182803 RepID=A0A4Y2R810_ARAVE|nr:hypothetical protein AVEN_154480-1 [Araneus ventricosus]GBN72672.1 hypothetical protein AVEN_241898-1 [Araneus ventricosus]
MKTNFRNMSVCQPKITITEKDQQIGDVDLKKNMDATGESSVCNLAHRDKVRDLSATLASETDGECPFIYGEYYLFP